MAQSDIDVLIQRLAKVPGLGPRSARRAVLHLLKKKETSLVPLIQSLTAVSDSIKTCGVCGHLDSHDPCGICSDSTRQQQTLCVVQDVADLWALERSKNFKGVYHVLGGTLSALDGIGPQDLRIDQLVQRVKDQNVQEVILATSATVEGQTTAHYIADCLADLPVDITVLAHGIPVGGELDYLDDGTLQAALNARKGIAS